MRPFATSLKSVFFGLAFFVLAANSALAQPIFVETFANNSAGWTLGPQWQIGSATTSSGQSNGNPDPAVDTTPTGDNGVAGMVIGGNTITSLHGYHFLESPAMDTSAYATVSLSFQRWLNSDWGPWMVPIVQVWNGSSWVDVFLGPSGNPGIQDSAWTLQTFDVTAHKNPGFRVRFGNNVGASSPFVVSNWNIDDVTVVGSPTGSDDRRCEPGERPRDRFLFGSERWRLADHRLHGDLRHAKRIRHRPVNRG